MVFGLDEEEGEQLDEKVIAIFEEISENPRHEGVRYHNQLRLPCQTLLVFSIFS